MASHTPRVQVPNNHILTQNLYYNYYYPNPKYLIIGYMDPLGQSKGFLALGFRNHQLLSAAASNKDSSSASADGGTATHKRSVELLDGEISSGGKGCMGVTPTPKRI